MSCSNLPIYLFTMVDGKPWKRKSFSKESKKNSDQWEKVAVVVLLVYLVVVVAMFEYADGSATKLKCLKLHY